MPARCGESAVVADASDESVVVADASDESVVVAGASDESVVVADWDGNGGMACVDGGAARRGGSGCPACARRRERSSTSARCSCRLGTPESSEPWLSRSLAEDGMTEDGSTPAWEGGAHSRSTREIVPQHSPSQWRLQARGGRQRKLLGRGLRGCRPMLRHSAASTTSRRSPSTTDRLSAPGLRRF